MIWSVVLIFFFFFYCKNFNWVLLGFLLLSEIGDLLEYLFVFYLFPLLITLSSDSLYLWFSWELRASYKRKKVDYCMDGSEVFRFFSMSHPLFFSLGQCTHCYYRLANKIQSQSSQEFSLKQLAGMIDALSKKGRPL